MYRKMRKVQVLCGMANLRKLLICCKKVNVNQNLKDELKLVYEHLAFVNQ